MAGEIIRDVVVRIQLEQIDAKLKVPDYAPVIKAQKFYEKGATQSSRKIQGSYEKVSKAVGGNAKKYEEAGRKAQEAARKIIDGNLKVADSAKLAGEGIFTLGRGIAFLGASSSDSFQESLRTIAKFQGAFDVFKGGTDLIKGTVEATRALKVATGAATVAEALHATAISVTSKAANVATASFTAMKVALGPVGLAVVGLTAGAAALATAWEFFGDAHEPIDRTAKSLENLANRNKAVNSEIVNQIVLNSKLRGIDMKVEDVTLSLLGGGEKREALEERAGKLEARLRRNRLETKELQANAKDEAGRRNRFLLAQTNISQGRLNEKIKNRSGEKFGPIGKVGSVLERLNPFRDVEKLDEEIFNKLSQPIRLDSSGASQIEAAGLQSGLKTAQELERTQKQLHAIQQAEAREREQQEKGRLQAQLAANTKSASARQSIDELSPLDLRRFEQGIGNQGLQETIDAANQLRQESGSVQEIQRAIMDLAEKNEGVLGASVQAIENSAQRIADLERRILEIEYGIGSGL